MNQILEYETNIASFNFQFSVPSELANYSIEVYGSNEFGQTLDTSVHEIVSGDVIIIQGQSNAEARFFNGSSNVNASPFIRVFANGTTDSTLLLNNPKWYVGEGDGNRENNGNTGQGVYG